MTRRQAHDEFTRYAPYLDLKPEPLKAIEDLFLWAPSCEEMKKILYHNSMVWDLKLSVLDKIVQIINGITVV